MKVAYLLPTTEFGGGIKVAVEHARLLVGRGHEVTVVAPGGEPEWMKPCGAFLEASEAAGLVEQDLVVATFWTTVQPALELERGPVAHFCQGYEGGLEHLAEQQAAIDDVYALDLPTLVVTPALGERLRQRFGRDFRVVSPPLDPRFRPMFRWRPRRRPRVFVPGIFEAPVKGVAHALEAVRLMEQAGRACTVVRASFLELSDAEIALREPEVFLRAAPVEGIAAQLRQSDLLLFPSREDEGFGLPLLEAMASKLPAVASSIGSVQYMAPRGVETVPFGDARAMAASAQKVLASPRRWRAMRRLGYEQAQRFRAEKIARDLEEAVGWAAQKRSESP